MHFTVDFSELLNGNAHSLSSVNKTYDKVIYFEVILLYQALKYETAD